MPVLGADRLLDGLDDRRAHWFLCYPCRPAVVGVYITVELTRGRIAAYWATGCGPLTVEKSSVVGPTKHK